MKSKYSLQKYKKMTLTVAIISTVAGVSYGLVKLAPLLRHYFKKQTETSIVRRSTIKDPPKQYPASKPKPKPQKPDVPSFRSKFNKLCKAVDRCKSIEEFWSALNSEDHRLAQKKYVKKELDKLLAHKGYWQSIGIAESVENCIREKMTCDCFDPFLESFCSN